MIEIIRNSTGKASDCFHFLRHTQLLFKHTPLRYVFRKYLVVDRYAVLIVDATTGAAHSDGNAVLPQQLHLHVLSFLRSREKADQALVLGRMLKYFYLQIFTEQLLGRSVP